MGKDRKDINPKDSAQVYDETAKDFRKKAPELVSYTTMVRPAIERFIGNYFLKETRGSVYVLDVGSASGRNVGTLISLGFSEKNIFGVEISPEQVAIAKKEFPHATFEVGDISNHELSKGRNDLVIEVMVPEFLDGEKFPESLKKIYDSMKNGGKFIYITTHPDRYEAKYGVSEGEVETNGPWNTEVKFTNYVRSVNSQVQALKDAGFNVEVVEEIDLPKEAREKHPEFTYPDRHARLAIVASKN